MGEYEHANLQARLTIWFGNHERDWDIRVLVEQRIRVSPGRYRIPDVCVIDRSQPIEPVFTRPPLICIEILSEAQRGTCPRRRTGQKLVRSRRRGRAPFCAGSLEDDSLRDMRQRVDDYLGLGVPSVWILDPASRKAYVCTPRAFQEPESGILEVTGSAIHVPLAGIFAELS